jgi:hypothetical protein
MNEIRELAETEVETVVGGSPLVNVPINIQNTIQTNLPIQNAVAIGIGGGPVTAGNLIGGLTNGSFGFQL